MAHGAGERLCDVAGVCACLRGGGEVVQGEEGADGLVVGREGEE